MAYKDKFNKQLSEGNTVLITPLTDQPFLIRIKKLKAQNIIVYDQYSYDGINWNTFQETTIVCDKTYKYIL